MPVAIAIRRCTYLSITIIAWPARRSSPSARQISSRTSGAGLGGLVEDQEARVGDERPRNGEHLLLAARELVAEVATALAEARKQLERARRRPRRDAGARRDGRR